MGCPMFGLLVFVAIILLQLAVICAAAASWQVTYTPASLNLTMKQNSNIMVQVDGLTPEILANDPDIQLRSEDEHVARVEQGSIMLTDGIYEGEFNVSGVFLGATNLFVEIKLKNNQTEKSDEKSRVTVIRPERVIDTVFTASVATLVSILYINFGCALDLPTLKKILIRPIGPIIGFFSQFLFMPLLSYGLGQLLFPTRFELQLGLFFTGVSPAGGASNIWTVVLGGNMNLSIAMTTISTIAAFGMMPLWLFTLGRTIFAQGNLGVPYTRIASFAVGLVIPLGIGVLIQKYMPRTSNLLVRVLKPFSIILVLFIVIFAIVTNLYLFQLFSWQIVVAGLGLPWAGYLFGYLSSKAFRLPSADALAISIETGIQNTGIAIFLLRFSLSQPEADLTTVIPVAAAIMTPFPLMILYVIQKIRERYCLPSNLPMTKDVAQLTEEEGSSIHE